MISTSLSEDAKGPRCANTVSSSKSQALETHLRNNEERKSKTENKNSRLSLVSTKVNVR